MDDAQLFVITSPQTFSAAVNCAADIEKNTQALFVGEPTGAGPNCSGDAKTFFLPHSKLRVRVSLLWWQLSDPRDLRRAILPDLPAPLTFAAYAAGRDPASEAIFDWDPRDLAGNAQSPNLRWQRSTQQ